MQRLKYKLQTSAELYTGGAGGAFSRAVGVLRPVQRAAMQTAHTPRPPSACMTASYALTHTRHVSREEKRESRGQRGEGWGRAEETDPVARRGADGSRQPVWSAVVVGGNRSLSSRRVSTSPLPSPGANADTRKQFASEAEPGRAGGVPVPETGRTGSTWDPLGGGEEPADIPRLAAALSQPPDPRAPALCLLLNRGRKNKGKLRVRGEEKQDTYFEANLIYAKAGHPNQTLSDRVAAQTAYKEFC